MSQPLKITGLLFSRASKLEFFRSEGIELSFHDLAVVQGENGELIGKVIIPPREVPKESVATNIKPVLRKATQKDVERYTVEAEKGREFFDICGAKILERKLPMKLVDVFLEDNRAIFFFFAEERVDFRALVKDLANSFHMRIEMRQIGARDAAKAIGALGPCGLTCCCETHLKEFSPISIAMAKNQGLSPNPAKLTGMCGKLKCCLSYENETYLSEKKNLHPLGSRVKTPDGEGVVVEQDIIKQAVVVRLDVDEKEKQCQHKFECAKCQLLSRPKGSGKNKEREQEKEKDKDKEYEKLEG